MSIVLAILAAIIVFCGYLLVDMIVSEKKRKELLKARLSSDNADI